MGERLDRRCGSSATGCTRRSRTPVRPLMLVLGRVMIQRLPLAHRWRAVRLGHSSNGTTFPDSRAKVGKEILINIILVRANK